MNHNFRRFSACRPSKDNLYDWEFVGLATTDQAQEGPNVFELSGKYWLIADVWQGLAVYSSDDCERFCRQNENILAESGTRNDDTVKGSHADVFVIKNRAFIVYFTHPDPNFRQRSSIQMAELKVEDGILKCDRNAEFSILN